LNTNYINLCSAFWAMEEEGEEEEDARETRGRR